LNAELRNIEGTLSSEREMHVNELKKLTALLSEQVITYQRMLSCLNLRLILKLTQYSLC
jgi:hypothetical protein